MANMICWLIGHKPMSIRASINGRVTVTMTFCARCDADLLPDPTPRDAYGIPLGAPIPPSHE